MKNLHRTENADYTITEESIINDLAILNTTDNLEELISDKFKIDFLIDVITGTPSLLKITYLESKAKRLLKITIDLEDEEVKINHLGVGKLSLDLEPHWLLEDETIEKLYTIMFERIKGKTNE
ncbi:MAG: hypothetical protein WAO49_07135 [Arcanobacterium sp.]|jgi:hypothetical protein